MTPPALPEERARVLIDQQLERAGWKVFNRNEVDLVNHRGVAVREVIMKTDHGRVDYLLYLDRRAIGVIEAKPEGMPLSGVEWQSAMYAVGLPSEYQSNAVLRDGRLPFVFEASGSETHFTNGFDPEPRARSIFNFPQPETLARTIREADATPRAATWKGKVRLLPSYETYDLRPASKRALGGIEQSLAVGRFDRSLVQMATGAGKTRMAVTECYRLLKFGGFNRVLFLVDRNNLGDQTLREFRDYVTPDDGRKFTDLYNVDKLTGAGMVGSSKVVISTIQRVFASLRGQTVADEDDPDIDGFIPEEAVNVDYLALMPPESFDLVIIDECHRSIFGVWRGVLEYFDAHLLGLTATPDKRAFGFFKQNLVSEYTFAQSVADGVNVDFEVYRISTEITDKGATVKAGSTVPVMNTKTRKQRLETIIVDVPYTSGQLDRTVTNPNQIRLILETFRDKLFTEIFPGRSEVPKTLIYAKDDHHAEEIVTTARQVFGKGNDLAAKITYTAKNPKELLQEFRNSPTLRIAVTVDMIATGTDVKPLECVFFMRDVRSALYFEQMKGRGCRTIDDATFQTVTSDATHKERFVILDAVGVTEHDFIDASPLERAKTVNLAKLLEKAATLTITADEVATLASRLARLERTLNAAEREELTKFAGQPLTAITAELVKVADPDEIAAAITATPLKNGEPDAKEAMRSLIERVITPLAGNAKLRQRILEIHSSHDRIIDDINVDRLLDAHGVVDTSKAREVITSWQNYLEENCDEITALQVLYSTKQKAQLTYAQLKELAEQLRRPPRSLTVDLVWKAYQAIETDKVKGAGRRTTTDLIALVRYTLGVDRELVPFGITVEYRYQTWLDQQTKAGVKFTDTQRWWLDRIKDAIIQSAQFMIDDLNLAPFTERGGIDGAARDLGTNAKKLIDQLNLALVA